MNKKSQFYLKLLIDKGKEKGYVTFSQINDSIFNDKNLESFQIEEIVNIINDSGIPVVENVSDVNELTFNVNNSNLITSSNDVPDVVLSKVNYDIGKTNDPVRMYMREMGTVELLTREGEIKIAKCIENNLNKIQFYLAKFLKSIDYFLNQYYLVKKCKLRLCDLIVGFVNYNIDLSLLTDSYLLFNNIKDNKNNLCYVYKIFIIKKFNYLSFQYNLLKKFIGIYTINHPYTKYELNKLISIFMEFKLSPKQFNYLVLKHKNIVRKIFSIEKDILNLCVNKFFISKNIFNVFFLKYGINKK